MLLSPHCSPHTLHLSPPSPAAVYGLVYTHLPSVLLAAVFHLLLRLAALSRRDAAVAVPARFQRPSGHAQPGALGDAGGGFMGAVACALERTVAGVLLVLLHAPQCDWSNRLLLVLCGFGLGAILETANHVHVFLIACACTRMPSVNPSELHRRLAGTLDQPQGGGGHRGSGLRPPPSQSTSALQWCGVIAVSVALVVGLPVFVPLATLWVLLTLSAAISWTDNMPPVGTHASVITAAKRTRLPQMADQVLAGASGSLAAPVPVTPAERSVRGMVPERAWPPGPGQVYDERHQGATRLRISHLVAAPGVTTADGSSGSSREQSALGLACSATDLGKGSPVATGTSSSYRALVSASLALCGLCTALAAPAAAAQALGGHFARLRFPHWDMLSLADGLPALFLLGWQLCALLGCSVCSRGAPPYGSSQWQVCCLHLCLPTLHAHLCGTRLA
jgi:hypothetical protein